jgi:hypothetical protein
MEVAIGDLSARKFDGSALSSRHKNLATLCPRLKNCWIHYQTNATQLPKIRSNCRKSFGKILMRKSRNYKNCVTHYLTALGAGVYLWKAAGSIIPKISWDRIDPDRGGWIYKKKTPAKLGSVQQGGSISIPGYARGSSRPTTEVTSTY